MERLTSDRAVPPHLRGAVVALGNFDGFHRGHQAVVARARALAEAEDRPLIVATFDPHPARIFRPEAPYFRLTSLDQRERLFARAGADAMLVFLFDHAMAAVSAEAFIDDWLIDRIGAAVVVTGSDFTFGAGRGGTVAMLGGYGERHGLRAHGVEEVLDGGLPISSSRIRTALQAGDCETASRLLGHPFAIRGEVIHGDQRGRMIGFPTANILLDRYLRPAYGIYAVRAMIDGVRVEGVANLGIRPTFDPPKELLEPYFFDFSGDLYGQIIEVELIAYLRPEAKYDGLDALIAAITADCAAAKRALAANPPLA
jgi:riboflavin kinase/FMN adenylyltransferase